MIIIISYEVINIQLLMSEQEVMNLNNEDREREPVGQVKMIPGSLQPKQQGNCKMLSIMLAIIVALIVLIAFQGKKIEALNEQSHSPDYQQNRPNVPLTINEQTPESKVEEKQAIQNIAKHLSQPSNAPYLPEIKNQKFEFEFPLIDGIHNPNKEHRSDDRSFPYRTVGIPNPGAKYNSSKVAPEHIEDFDSQVNNIFKPYNDTTCEFFRIGDKIKPVDGGYVMCRNYIKDTQALINIGFNGFDSFGCEMAALNRMPNYQYDCTSDQKPICATGQAQNHFDKICLGQQTQVTPTYTFLSLEDMIKINGLYKRRILLKIDVEGMEYSGLKTFPVHNFEYIDQMVIQFHFGSYYQEQWGILDIFKTLNEYFVTVNYHMNNIGCQQNRKLKSTSFEVTLVNKRLLKINRPTQSFAPHSLNKKNAEWLPSCDIQQQ